MNVPLFRSSSNGAEWELGVYHCDSLLFPNEDCDDDTATTDNDDDLNLDAPWVKLVTVGSGVAAGDASHVRVSVLSVSHLRGGEKYEAVQTKVRVPATYSTLFDQILH